MTYQYGVRTIRLHPTAAAGHVDAVERYATKSIAAATARDWAISPLRTGPRRAELVRRRGWEGGWEIIESWTSPEAHS